MLSSGKRPKQLKALQRSGNRKRKRDMTSEEREQVEGSTFEDEGVTWKVIKAQWDSSLGCIIVVFYYGHDSALCDGLNEDDLHEDHEHVEHSSLAEVLSWIGS